MLCQKLVGNNGQVVCACVCVCVFVGSTTRGLTYRRRLCVVRVCPAPLVYCGIALQGHLTLMWPIETAALTDCHVAPRPLLEDQ